MTPHPVLVIGIGRAGCEILSTVDEYVSAEGVEDHFRFLAIDSSRRDLETFAPDGVAKYELTIDSGAYQSDQERLGYLQRETDLVPEAGTSRRRPLGRYLIDSNADSAELYGLLSDQIRALSDISTDSRSRHVWVLNSLGGGTGSGAFPLVTLLLERCRQEIGDALRIFGIGSLPRLDGLQEQLDVPAGEPVHYANAYTALAELRRLMNVDGNASYPIDIEIDTSSNKVKSAPLSIEQNPFAGYWLLGFSEAEQLYADDGYRQNQVAAQLIFYLASTGGDNWFHRGHLYSVAGVSVEAPVEELRQYWTLERKLDRLDDELGALRDQRDTLISATESIDSLIRASTHAPSDEGDETLLWSDPPESLPFDEDLLSDCRELSSMRAATSEPTSSPVDVLDTRVEAILEEHQDRFPEYVPAEPTVRLLCAAFLLSHTRQEIATHPLPDHLETLQHKWLSDELSDGPPPEVGGQDGQQAESFREWRETLLEALHQRKDDLQDQISTTLVPRFLSASGLQLTELQNDLEQADQLVAEYEALRDLEASLTQETQRVRRRLKDQRQHLETELETAQEEWEATQQQWARLSQQRSDLASSLKEPTRQARRVRVSIDFEQEPADSELVDPNFSSLLSNGLVREADLRASLEEAMTLLEEPVEDLAESQFGKTTGRLGVIAAESDRSLFSEMLMSGGESTDSLRRELYYQFEAVDDIVPATRGGSLSLLGFYTPVSLQDTSEFGTIHRYYTDPELDVSSLFDSISDADLRERFAYPELVE